MDAPLSVIIIFIVLLLMGLVALLASIVMERDRLRKWVQSVRSANESDDGKD